MPKNKNLRINYFIFFKLYNSSLICNDRYYKPFFEPSIFFYLTF